ncbi:MAG: restriction endonuclease subunit S [Ruminococcus sp.]|nr:restriction endonuclease subunit S [Ruminococcus sp.]
MTAQQLKNSILQMAVQGKLVPQNPDDEPASVLLERIRVEKQEFIRQGKIKKDKCKSDIIKKDEVPFEIPDSWEWTRLGDILLKLTDGTHSTPKYTINGIPFISVKDVSSGNLDFSNCKHISEKEHNELYERCNPEFGDILLTKVGTTGIPIIIDTNEKFSLFVSVALLKFNQKLLYNKYLQYMINSPLVQKQATENTKGVGNKNWVIRDIANTLIVIPPLAEQHRIVEKIEELLPYIEAYEKAETQLTALNKAFPEMLKKSILQEAVQGRLVPQNPDDEPASVLLERIRAEKQSHIKEGKIKKDKKKSDVIKIDEVPFEIPDSWEWCKLSDISIKEIKRGKSPVYAVEGTVCVFAQKCNVKTGDINIGLAKYLSESVITKYPQEEYMQDSDIIVNSTGTGTLGRIGFYINTYNPNNIPLVPDSHVTIVRVHRSISKYIYYIMKWYQPYLEKCGEGSTKQKELKADRIKELFIPIPPLAEQKRIVKRIEELMKYCDIL